MVYAVEVLVPSRFNPNVPERAVQPLKIVGMENETLLIRYHKELYPDMQEIEANEKGDFIDLRAVADVTLKQFEYAEISLGISMMLSGGFSAILMPRSSTFKKYGIIQSNSVGLIDESYCGDNDIWKMPVIAMRDTEIHKGDRICQFGIIQKIPVALKEVPSLHAPDRGGFGEGTKDVDNKKPKEETGGKVVPLHKTDENGTILL